MFQKPGRKKVLIKALYWYLYHFEGTGIGTDNVIF